MVLLLLALVLMWIIWGSVILSNASYWAHDSTCHAELFWWQQFASFVGIPVVLGLGCVVGRLSRKCCGGVDATLNLFGFLAPQMLWVVGYALFSIVLWTSLGDKHNNNLDGTETEDADCSDILQGHATGGPASKSAEQFLVLWKVTACVHFILALINVVCFTKMLFLLCYNQSYQTIPDSDVQPAVVSPPRRRANSVPTSSQDSP